VIPALLPEAKQVPALWGTHRSQACESRVAAIRLSKHYLAGLGPSLVRSQPPGWQNGTPLWGYRNAPHIRIGVLSTARQDSLNNCTSHPAEQALFSRAWSLIGKKSAAWLTEWNPSPGL
jgi:hypothetical protein